MIKAGVAVVERIAVRMRDPIPGLMSRWFTLHMRVIQQKPQRFQKLGRMGSD